MRLPSTDARGWLLVRGDVGLDGPTPVCQHPFVYKEPHIYGPRVQKTLLSGQKPPCPRRAVVTGQHVGTQVHMPGGTWLAGTCVAGRGARWSWDCRTRPHSPCRERSSPGGPGAHGPVFHAVKGVSLLREWIQWEGTSPPRQPLKVC